MGLLAEVSHDLLGRLQSWRVLKDPSNELLLKDPSKELLLKGPSKELLLKDPSKELLLKDPSKELLLKGPSKELLRASSRGPFKGPLKVFKRKRTLKRSSF